MSDDWIDPRAESRQRKRAAAELFGIAVLAGLVVLVGLKFIPSHSSGASASGPRPLDSLTNSATPSARPHSSASAPAQSPQASSTSSPTRRHRRHPVASCPTSAACTLPTDGGRLVDAINRYRSRHGVGSVPGQVSKAAQECAIGNGDTSNCPPSYYWEPVPRWSGRQVLVKIEGNGGADYLLDPSVKKFQVGWAYDPSSGEYFCAVVAVY
jgi:hypothetical protein